MHLSLPRLCCRCRWSIEDRINVVWRLPPPCEFPQFVPSFSSLGVSASQRSRSCTFRSRTVPAREDVSCDGVTVEASELWAAGLGCRCDRMENVLSVQSVTSRLCSYHHSRRDAMVLDSHTCTGQFSRGGGVKPSLSQKYFDSAWKKLLIQPDQMACYQRAEAVYIVD